MTQEDIEQRFDTYCCIGCSLNLRVIGLPFGSNDRRGATENHENETKSEEKNTEEVSSKVAKKK